MVTQETQTDKENDSKCFVYLILHIGVLRVLRSLLHSIHRFNLFRWPTNRSVC